MAQSTRLKEETITLDLRQARQNQFTQDHLKPKDEMFFYTILVTKKPWQHEPPKAFVTESTFYLGNEKHEDFLCALPLCNKNETHMKTSLLRFGVCSSFSNSLSPPTVIQEFTRQVTTEGSKETPSHTFFFPPNNKADSQPGDKLSIRCFQTQD